MIYWQCSYSHQGLCHTFSHLNYLPFLLCCSPYYTKWQDEDFKNGNSDVITLLKTLNYLPTAFQVKVKILPHKGWIFMSLDFESHTAQVSLSLTLSGHSILSVFPTQQDPSGPDNFHTVNFPLELSIPSLACSISTQPSEPTPNTVPSGKLP